MSSRKSIGLLNGVALIVVIAYLVWDGQTGTAQRLAVMDNFIVFDAFEYKQMQDTLLKEKEEALHEELIGMVNELNEIRDQLKEDNKNTDLLNRYNDLKQNFNQAQKEIEKELKKESTLLTNSVYKKLNEKVEAFGKQNGYTAILGANGQGNLMYFDQAIDVTEELITYINTQAEGADN